MASLQDIVKKNKRLVKGPGGVLTEETPESVQSLAGQFGLPAAPIDPQSTVAIGGNAHQAKMAGTPNQVQNAIRSANDPSQRLSDATRTADVRTQQTHAEKAKSEKSQALQDLGQLGDRVHGFIEAQRQKLAQAAPVQQEVAVEESQITGLPSDPASLTALKNDLATFRQNPNDMQALLRINTTLGRAANSVLRPDEVGQLFQSAVDAITKGGADVIDNSLDVDDLMALGNFPYDAAQLEELLGVPRTEVGKYSVGQLRQALEAAAQAEFQNTAALEQQATSGLLGAAERGEARGQAREASRTGVRSTEQDIQNLERQIENADQVMFAGQVVPVDQLLRDDVVSQTISDFFKSPEARARLEATEPQLVEFIRKNEALLSEAAKQMQAGASEFGDIQQDNQALATVGSQAIDPALMAAVVPGYGQLSADRIDPSKHPFLAHIASLPADKAEAFVAGSTQLATNPLTKDVVPELASLSDAELSALQLQRGADSPAVKKLLANREMKQKLNNLAGEDPAVAVQTLTGGQYTDPGQLQDAIVNNMAASVLGLGGADTSTWDGDRDGRLDSIDSLINKAQASTPGATLKGILSGQVQTYQPRSLERYNPPKEVESVFSKLKPYTLDGSFSPEELKQANLSEDELWAAKDAGLSGKWGDTGRLLEGLVARHQQANSRVELARYPTTPAPKEPTQYNPGLALEYEGISTRIGEDAVRLENRLRELESSSAGRRYEIEPLKQRLNHLRISSNIFKEYATKANTPPPPPPPGAPKAKEQKWYEPILQNHVVNPITNPVAATKEALSYNPVKGTETTIAGAQQVGKDVKGSVAELKKKKWKV